MNKPHIDTHKIKDAPAPVISKLVEKREGVFSRFPLLFTLLGAFGLVATFYGFEHLIDSIDPLADNPILLLTVGISTLIVTGSLYKKLG